MKYLVLIFTLFVFLTFTANAFALPNGDGEVTDEDGQQTGRPRDRVQFTGADVAAAGWQDETGRRRCQNAAHNLGTDFSEQVTAGEVRETESGVRVE